MKKFLILLVSVLLCLSLCACGEGEVGGDPGKKGASASSFREGFEADKAIDEDVNTGWIGRKKASETNMQTFDLDFGVRTAFTKIVLNDTFTAGYTNKRPAYLKTSVVYGNGNTSSLEKGTSVSNVVVGEANGLSWKSEIVPTEETPVLLWVSLATSVNAVRLAMDNEMNNSVSAAFDLYISETPHTNKNWTDLSTYTLIRSEAENEDKTVEIPLEQKTAVRDVLLVIKSQINEGAPVNAALDELFFYGEVPEDYSEEHYPVKFTIMGSNNGKEFEEICAEPANYQSVWEKTLDEAVSYRYIRYIVFEELNNNYPSIGEIIFS